MFNFKLSVSEVLVILNCGEYLEKKGSLHLY